LNFDLKALFEALDAERRARQMSWAAVMREINRFDAQGNPIATSTITGLKDKRVAEGDGVLQMLLWLRRSPESFLPGFPDAENERFRLPVLPKEQILRWDAKALYAAVEEQRGLRGMTWKDVAQEVGGVTPNMLANLAKGGRTGFPVVMRVTGWLRRPAADFTRAVPRGLPSR